MSVKKSRSLSRASVKREGARLDRQDRRSFGPALLECTMGVRGVLEREALLNLDLHLTAANHVEQLGCRLLELLPGRDIMVQGWTRQIERALLRQEERGQGFHGSRRIAEADHEPAHLEAIERLEESGAPNTVINHRELF